jgi:hypothetical protein
VIERRLLVLGSGGQIQLVVLLNRKHQAQDVLGDCFLLGMLE